MRGVLQVISKNVALPGFFGQYKEYEYEGMAIFVPIGKTATRKAEQVATVFDYFRDISGKFIGGMFFRPYKYIVAVGDARLHPRAEEAGAISNTKGLTSLDYKEVILFERFWPTMEFDLLHELAHVLTGDRYPTTFVEAAQRDKNYPSFNAELHPAEDFAESFALYVLDRLDRKKYPHRFKFFEGHLNK